MSNTKMRIIVSSGVAYAVFSGGNCDEENARGSSGGSLGDSCNGSSDGFCNGSFEGDILSALDVAKAKNCSHLIVRYKQVANIEQQSTSKRRARLGKEATSEQETSTQQDANPESFRQEASPEGFQQEANPNATKILQKLGAKSTIETSWGACAWEIDLSASEKLKQTEREPTNPASYETLSRQQLANYLDKTFGQGKNALSIAFVPHQDDEVFTLAGAIFSASKHGDVATVLCTDGKACETRLHLADGESCEELNDNHEYSFTEVEYGKLRDLEFIEACQALGVPKQNIILDHERMEDGKTCKADSVKIVARYARMWPEAKFITHTPLEPFENPAMSDEDCAHRGSIEHVVDWSPEQPLWAQQHPDHRVLGQAVSKLCVEGIIQHAIFCVEFYHLQQFHARYPQKLLLCHEATDDEIKKLSGAVKAYCSWNPGEQKYALGWHSASMELIYIKNNPNWYSYEYHSPKPFFAELQNSLNKNESKKLKAAFKLFNEAFVEPNPNVFQDFSNFAYKHFHNPFKLENNMLFDCENSDWAEDSAGAECSASAKYPAGAENQTSAKCPATAQTPTCAEAVICCVGMPMLMPNGNEAVAACLADFAAKKDAKPSAALKAVSKIKPTIQAVDCAFSYVDGTDTASAIQMKFGYVSLDGFDVYNIDFPLEDVKCLGSDALEEMKGLLNSQIGENGSADLSGFRGDDIFFACRGDINLSDFHRDVDFSDFHGDVGLRLYGGVGLSDFNVVDYQTCPFTDADFEDINTSEGDAIRGRRSLEFFEHFVDGLDYRQFAYIVARHKAGNLAGRLAGYMIIELACGFDYKRMQVVDWRICDADLQAQSCERAESAGQAQNDGQAQCGERMNSGKQTECCGQAQSCGQAKDNKQAESGKQANSKKQAKTNKIAVVAAMLSHCALNANSIEWGHINPWRRDLEFIEAFDGVQALWNERPAKNKLLVLPVNDFVKKAIADASADGVEADGDDTSDNGVEHVEADGVGAGNDAVKRFNNCMKNWRLTLLDRDYFVNTSPIN